MALKVVIYRSPLTKELWNLRVGKDVIYCDIPHDLVLAQIDEEMRKIPALKKFFARVRRATK